MADELVIRAVADHLFNRDTLVEAGRLAKSAPEQLTDLHLSHLACYCSDRELTDIVQRRADAIEAEDDAFRAKVYAAQQRAVADAATALRYTPAPSVPNFTVRGGDYHTTAITDLTAKQLEDLTPEDFCARFPDVSVTTGMLGPVLKFLDDMNARNRERNDKITMLEQRAATLEQRLTNLHVELEAERAVRR